jgi:hypothetical protein
VAEVREVPEQFTTDFQGNTYVLFDGLLALAHEDGLKEMDTEILMGPSEKNNHSWIMKAKVVTEKGTFWAIGDANAENVNRNIGRHIIRMAETRATARALRKAVNVGMTSIEELVTEEPEPRSQGRQQSGGAQRGGAKGSTPRSKDLISKADAGRLRWLLGELGANIPAFEEQKGKIDEMSKARGEEWLKSVEARYEQATAETEEETEEATEETAPESGTEDVDLTEADFEDIPF